MPNGLSRREFLRRSGSAAAGIALVPPTSIWQEPEFDLVIRGGTIADGTGGPLWGADLGLRGDAISAIGTIDPEQGRRVLNANGLCVSPGFIDIHTHSDGSILRYPTADSRVMQGVTTEVTGNCGGSAAPVEGMGVQALGEQLDEYGIEASWTDVASYFHVLEEVGISLNHALLLGQGTIRSNVAGAEDRPLDDDEFARVLGAVQEGMDHGAFGLSTGLEYVPGRFTPTAEIVAMARVVARRGGLYASHIRNEESTLLEALDEAIRIGRESGARVQVSHLKAAGEPNWGKQVAALSLIESARQGGVDVLADAYPYTAYSTGLTIFMPAWAASGGWEAASERLRDASAVERLRRELDVRVKQDPGDYDLIVISSVKTDENQDIIGKDLATIAEQWGLAPVDALLRLVAEEEGSVGFIGHGMSPSNVRLVLSHPLVMIGSDGSSMAPTGPAARTRPHPRSYGTFPRVLGHYCREEGIFDLPTAIKKMTSMPADQMGIRNRGRVARGMKADLVLFDADLVRDEATFETPHRYPTGIHHVLVNGHLVVENGEHTGKRSGQVLRKG